LTGSWFALTCFFSRCAARKMAEEAESEITERRARVIDGE
jgi:hypothetical protein